MFVPPPHEQSSQPEQQQADAHAAHDEAGVVRLLSQRHLAQMPDGVRLAPLKEVKGCDGVKEVNLNNTGNYY